MGNILKIQPSCISLTGSARLGYSLRQEQLGKKFGEISKNGKISDLDFFAVSAELFTKLEKDFYNWRDMHIRGLLIEHNLIYLKNMKEEIPKQIRRGYIHSLNIKSIPELPSIYLIKNTMWKLGERLKDTNISWAKIKLKDPELRVYKDFNSCLTQRKYSIDAVIEKLNENRSK